MTATALAALLLAVAVATTAIVAPRPARAQTMPNPAVCDRTPQIRDAIVASISGVTNCTDVTSAHLTSIQGLDARETGLRTLHTGDFNGMTGLRTLRLLRNSLSSVPATVFSGLSAIEEISLQHNQLESLDKTTFNGLTTLEIIDLGDNRLRSLDKAIFSGLTNLKTVFISDNRELTSLDKAIFNGLTSLENVHLWRSGLTSLDKATFSGLSSIKEISIQANAIGTLHKDTLSGLTTLTKFHAFGNPFGNLDKDTFNGLSNLEELWLQRVGIQSLDKDIFDGLNALKVLRLNANSITSLDEDIFDGLTSLEQLWLDYNEITSLHENIFDDQSGLIEISVGGNRLTSLHEDTFDGLINLTSLAISGNEKMASLPSNVFAGLTALRELRMEGLSPNFVYPDGLLVGLTSLDIFYAGGPNGYPPAIFDVNLVRTPGDASEAKIRIPVGAPFDMDFRMQAAGHDEGGAFLNDLHHATILTGSIESETFNLPTVPNDDIPNFVNADRSIVIDMNFDDAPFSDRCGSEQNSFSCYSGFGFSNGVLPPACSAGTASFDSARIVCEQSGQSVNNRNYYAVWKMYDETSIIPLYTGIHDPVSASSHVIELQGLAPDQGYEVWVHGVSEDGILSMRFIPWYASTSYVEFRTAEQPALAPPLVGIAPNSLRLVWMPPAESIEVRRSSGWRDLAVLGYQVRYKKTAEAASAYSQWQTIETETTADGGQTTTLDWLFVSQLVGGELYDIQIRTITGVADEPQGYSEPATTTILTFIPVPGVNRIEPATPEVSVRAGDRIRLSADIYNSQDILDNDDAENGEGAFKRWQPELEWTSSGAGSFDDASGRRSIVYTAPSLPGVYTVTAEVGPPGLCRAHHPGVEEQDGDPCMAQFTLRVSREAEAPTAGPGPVNPAFVVPPRVTDDAGTAFSVFTPVEGGTFSGTGITVSARPGSVPDRAVLAVAATTSTTTASPDSEFTLHGTAWDVIGMSRTGGAGFTAVTEYRLDEPLTACLQVPWDQLDNLSNITVVEIRSDGLVGPLTSNLRTADGTTAACGRLSRVPATLAIATRADAASGTTVVPTAAATQQELPEAGGSSPTVNILAAVLLSGLATVAVAVAAAVAMRARRPAHTRARE